jgi:phytanoyl-CoA hydroxylase
MLGHGAPPAKQLTFQLDQGGSYTRSDMGVHQGPTRDYRRIEGLEHEPLVAAFLAHPLIDQIFNRYYGDTVQRRRPVMMNKPAGKSTPLPWHQDVPVGPRCLPTDTPIATIWTAIDAADPDNGCMDMVPGSHKHGILNAGNFTSAENVAKYAHPDRVCAVQVPAGHAVMFNNCMLHSSGANASARARRAIVVRPIFDMRA